MTKKERFIRAQNWYDQFEREVELQERTIAWTSDAPIDRSFVWDRSAQGHDVWYERNRASFESGYRLSR